MPSLPTLLAVFSFLWGAIWGSLRNVVIGRRPRGEYQLKPPTHSPPPSSRLPGGTRAPAPSSV